MRGGGELIYFFLAPFHNQLKRQRGEIYFKGGRCKKREPDQAKQSRWVGQTDYESHANIFCKFKLVVSVLSIKNYVGDDEDDVYDDMQDFFSKSALSIS